MNDFNVDTLMLPYGVLQVIEWFSIIAVGQLYLSHLKTKEHEESFPSNKKHPRRSPRMDSLRLRQRRSITFPSQISVYSCCTTELPHAYKCTI